MLIVDASAGDYSRAVAVLQASSPPGSLARRAPRAPGTFGNVGPHVV
jgi:hypothetical protein